MMVIKMALCIYEDYLDTKFYLDDETDEKKFDERFEKMMEAIVKICKCERCYNRFRLRDCKELKNGFMILTEDLLGDD